MSNSQKRIQNKTISCRVPESIYEHIKNEATSNNKTVSAYMKLKVLGDEAKKLSTIRVPRHDEKLLRKILGQLGKIGCNINQVAKVVNTDGYYDESYTYLYDWMSEIYGMRNLLVKALGIEETNDI